MLTEKEKWHRKLKTLNDKKQAIYNQIAQEMSEVQLKIDKHVASCKHSKEYLKLTYKDWGTNGFEMDYETTIECDICGRYWHVDGKVKDLPR